MGYINFYLSRFFDLLLSPFNSLHPFWPLLVFSLITGIIMLVIFRYTSNQQGIKQAKTLIKAHILEIRLFKDDLGILLSAQRSILGHNFTYIKHGLKPMLVMMIPVVLILIQLDGWFGYRPLNIGESSVVSVKFSDKDMRSLSNISIETGSGVTVETPPLRIPSEGEVSWRIRPIEPGEHTLTFKTDESTFQKRFVAANGKLDRVSSVVASSFWDSLLRPGERPIAESSSVNLIEVDYPSRSIEIFGWGIHWLVVFFVLSIAFGFAFKGLFKVEI